MPALLIYAMKKYLFIDRDGTLVSEPEDYQIDSITKVRLVPGVIPALLKLQQAGYSLVMVSNQDGLGTASFPLDTFTPAHEFILDLFHTQGIDFEEVLICPHLPTDDCACRKPKLGLVMAYLKDTSWDRAASCFIGDRVTDLQMGQNMGLRALLLRDDNSIHGINDGLSWSEIATLLTRRERVCTIERKTKETAIKVSVDLDHSGDKYFNTGIGFFDHMLDQIATHGGFSLRVEAQGDLEVDAHHTIEDTGIVLGQALKQALLDKRGIGRFGFALPMDEVYAQVFADSMHADPSDKTKACLDISGRPYCVLDFKGQLTDGMVGDFPVQMTEHFFYSLACAMGLTLHLEVTAGNCHHQIEALFKAFGRALRRALAVQGNELPSSKGSL